MAYGNNGLGSWPGKLGFPAIAPDAMQQATETYQAWCKCMAVANAEATKFLTHRVQEDIQFPMRIVQCRSPQEVVQKQIEFWNTMARDYALQTQKMQSILTESYHSMDRPAALDWPTPKTENNKEKSGLKAA